MSRNSRLHSLCRFVYVIGPQQGLQKVGLATDVQARLAALQTANPLELLVHAAVAVPFREAHAIERHAHQLLISSRVRNEWFDTVPAEAVTAVQSASASFAGRATPIPEPAAIWPAVSTWWIRKASVQPSIAPVAEGTNHDVYGLPLFAFRSSQRERSDFAPETPLEALAAHRIELHCCGPVTSYPVRLLASSLPQGGRTQLEAALGLFRCERCQSVTRQAVLVAHDDMGEAIRFRG